MKVLGFTSQSRHILRALSGIHALQWDGILHWLFIRGHDIPSEKSESAYRKACIAQQRLLSSDYDALLIVDDDMLIPPHTLTALAVHNTDIAYALYIRRDDGHYWTACTALDERSIKTFGRVEMDAAWGKSVDVAGIGTGCTLIKRRVLERIQFSRRGTFGYDWYLAVDAQRAGFGQLMDTTLHIGHVDPDAGVIYYPTADGYRIEPYA